MAEIIQITTSSQIKSADTKSEIANHNGKENRAKYNHKNEDIDTSMSHLNAEFDFYDRDELLEKHYREKIDKHNKNNNSAKRRWESVDDYLKTFEGKKVKIAGQETDNERWATMSQISYFGGKDTLGEVIEELKDLGVDYERICEQYAEGYKNYVKAHNERFTTLPIYHSDVHFDETTPHGHDAIVVMGHTLKGNPSDSFNNALGELYGYPENFEGKRKNIERYREENDELIFKSIAPKIAKLAKDNGLNIDFEAIRTGEEGSLDMEEFKVVKDLERREEELKEKRERNAKKNAELKITERNLKDREDKLKKEQDALNAEREQFRQEIANEREKLKKALEERTFLQGRIRQLRASVSMFESADVVKPPLEHEKMKEILERHTGGKMSAGKNKEGKSVLGKYLEDGRFVGATPVDLVPYVFEIKTTDEGATATIDDAIKLNEVAMVVNDISLNGRHRSDDATVQDGIDSLTIATETHLEGIERQKEQERTL